ncbi:MAG: hypothetical protein ACI8U4_001630, partial [Natronomonas sp.]
MMPLQAATDAATSLLGRFLNEFFNLDPAIADPIGYAL